jgi:hypothetical protein
MSIGRCGTRIRTIRISIIDTRTDGVSAAINGARRRGPPAGQTRRQPQRNGIVFLREGGIVQSTSWTLHEAVEFGRTAIKSADWSRYPILRLPEIPGSVDVHVIDRPGTPFLGTGEAAQGPTAAAIAGAIANASGARIRELPLDRKRVKAAIGL